MSDKWRTVCTETYPLMGKTHRLKVLGGWLYRTTIKTHKGGGGYGYEISMCFVPDPQEPQP